MPAAAVTSALQAYTCIVDLKGLSVEWISVWSLALFPASVGVRQGLRRRPPLDIRERLVMEQVSKVGFPDFG